MDVVSGTTLLSWLPIEDFLAIRLVSKKFYQWSDNDELWWKFCFRRFKLVRKSDIALKPAYCDQPITWFMVYVTMMDAIRQDWKVVTTSVFGSYCVRDGILSTCYPQDILYLNGQPSKVCSHPMVAGIVPRRGDTILNMKQIGYRHDGLSYWNGDLHIEGPCDIDDYGTYPYEFAYPEFPTNYFYCGHSEGFTMIVDSQFLKDWLTPPSRIYPEGHRLEPINGLKVGDLLYISDDDYVQLLTFNKESIPYEPGDSEQDDYSTDDEND